jgi:hypothetical protein
VALVASTLAPVVPPPEAGRVNPGAAATYTLSFFAHPSRCVVRFNGTGYVSGASNSSVKAGFYPIVAAFCPGEAFVSWSSTAGSVAPSNQSQASLTVSSNGTLTANFVRGYNVTFNETGLVVGTSWAAEVRGVTQSNSTNLIPFVLINGSYNYTIQRQQDFAAKYAGSFVVNGADVMINVRFTSISYSVTFVENGLPPLLVWWVDLNLSIAYSNTAWLTFAIVNGTYAFKVPDEPGYHSNVTWGNVTVHGHALSVYIAFDPNGSGSSGWGRGTWYILGGVLAIGGLGGAGFYVIHVRRRSMPPARP